MHVRGTIFAVVLLAGLIRAVPNAAVQQPADGQSPAFRSGVELVIVEVGVVDRNGVPLRNLGPGDFSVTVDGDPRRVVNAEFVDAAQRPAASVEESDVVPVSTNERAGGRLLVFILDTSAMEPGDARQVAADTARFFSGLTLADRSALISLPVGTSVGFTWAHDQVREALVRGAALGGTSPTNWEFGSLSEARDIATRGGTFALRDISARACGNSSPGTVGIAAPTAPGAQGGSGGQSPAAGGGRMPSSSQAGDGASDSCMRELQRQAELTWSMTRATSLSSLTALRQQLNQLRRVQGDKTVVLISGGWPLEQSEETAVVDTVAAEAAQARATIFSVFVPRLSVNAESRRSISSTPLIDQSIHYWPLETLASKTGGRSFRVGVGAEGIFDRLAREVSGYYRLGVEKKAGDAGASGREMKVEVRRPDITVRAREIFDLATYEDRDWAARLGSALDSPIPATALGLRVTSYVAQDPDQPARLRLVLTGEASRVQPGEATLQIVVRDLKGTSIAAGGERLGEPEGNVLPFAVNMRVPPGSYMVRVAIMDGAGRVGSVDHRVEARPVQLGKISVTGPLLVHVPPAAGARPRFTIDGMHQTERLAIEVGMEGDRAALSQADVEFEIAATTDGPALIRTPASLVEAPGRADVVRAQAVADVRVLPPGQYLLRAKVTTSDGAQGEVHRAFTVLRSPSSTAETVAASSATAAATSFPVAPPSVRGQVIAAVPAFALDDVLAQRVLGGFLDRVALQPEAASGAAHDLLDRARSGTVADLKISDAEAAQAPVAAFLHGLSLLAQKKLDPAATAFRSAMRLSPRFYPAMVYLGACYAAAGKDKEAAAIWRTALIKEGEVPELHLLLADALLRQGNGALAFEVVGAARARWHEDEALNHRFVLAALLAGDYTAGLRELDAQIERGSVDEPSLALALLVLYESLANDRPVEGIEQDRTRMMRLAETYRARGGPSLPLVEAWLKAATGGTR